MEEIQVVKEEKIETSCIFMRTVVKKDVYDRLKDFAQQYSTGRGNWDFGVAIQILLDWYDASQLSSVNDKLDTLLAGLNTREPETKEEEKFEEFLGGYKEKVKKE